LDEEIFSAGIKEPRNSQQEKKVYAKMHGFCCDTKFKKRVSAIRKRGGGGGVRWVWKRVEKIKISVYI